MVGRGQAVRRGTLDPVFEGSKPSAPATSTGGPGAGPPAMRPPLAGNMGDPFMAIGFGELKVFSGSAHPALARDIAAFLGVEMGQARLRRFPDTEVSFQIDENIRGTDVFIVQPTCGTATGSVDQHLMELMIMVDAFRRSSAARITAVIPDYG